jgi:hypothetical protein
MKITFLGQGFESISAKSVGNYLRNYLNQTDFHSFTALSAFASESAIFGLANDIQNANNTSKV